MVEAADKSDWDGLVWSCLKPADPCLCQPNWNAHHDYRCTILQGSCAIIEAVVWSMTSFSNCSARETPHDWTWCLTMSCKSTGDGAATPFSILQPQFSASRQCPYFCPHILISEHVPQFKEEQHVFAILQQELRLPQQPYCHNAQQAFHDWLHSPSDSAATVSDLAATVLLPDSQTGYGQRPVIGWLNSSNHGHAFLAW